MSIVFLKVEVSKAGLKALESDNELVTEEEDECDESDVFDIPESVAKGQGGAKKREKIVKKKQQSAMGSKIKKTAGRKRLQAISHDPEESDREDESVAGPSKVNEEGKSTGRGRPTCTPQITPIVDEPAENTIDAKEKSKSSRVLRTQKKGSKEKKNYCEISSDEEVDEFTSMMNIVHDNYEQIYSEEE